MKICILGGGTAGWLSALYILRRQPVHEITVIDSSRIGIIGTGEGSTGVFADTLTHVLKISSNDFLLNTGATQKLGIRFHNWTGDGRSFIGPLDNTRSAFHNPQLFDTSLLYHCQQHGRSQVHLSTICGHLVERGLGTAHRTEHSMLPVHSYHFDGHQVGAYFKQLAMADGVQHIDGEYTSSQLDQQGYIESITLASGEKIAADIFIDATGFARLLGKEVDAGWHSYSADITCDRAMPFHLPNAATTEALTEAVAMSSGWMWQIPTQQRRGCGYVYDSRFITDEQAQAEIEQHLGHPIQPIRVIKFDSGRVERTFSRNVVSVGIAGNFLEPLQATNIHGTISQLYFLTEFWLRGDRTAGPQETKHLNQAINQGFDTFADLVQIHYHSGRSDTEFWRFQQNIPLRPQVALLQEMGQHRWPIVEDWPIRLGGSGYGPSIYPLVEYGWMDGAIAREQIPNPQLAQELYQEEQAQIAQLVAQCRTHQDLVEQLRLGRIRPPVVANPELSRWLSLGR